MKEFGRREFLDGVRKAIPFIPFLVPALIDVACNSGPSEREKALQQLDKILATRGVWGEQELISLETFRNPQASGSLKGSLSGGFFLFGGSISGNAEGRYSAETISTIQFAWKTNPPNPKDAMIVLSELPISKVLFQEVKEPDSKPTVRFELDKNNLIRENYTTNYRPIPIDPVHPDGFLKVEGVLKGAIFHVPPHLLKEILPSGSKK